MMVDVKGWKSAFSIEYCCRDQNCQHCVGYFSDRRPASAQPFDETHMYNMGVHAGRAMWAIRHCNARATPALEVIGRLGQTTHTHAFTRGFDYGMTDAYKADKTNRQVACMAVAWQYGKNGRIVRGLLEWSAHEDPLRDQR